jgi:Uma2 family endonuclease
MRPPVFVPAASGFTVEDLDRIRDETNLAHVELDPWGSLIAFPADDGHDVAAAELARQALLQLPHVVSVNGFAWTVPGGTGYVMKPDLLVLARDWKRVDELHFDPAPLLVVEIASRSSRHVDRTRKMDDYRLGGAGVYLLVDLPNTFEAHEFATGRVMKAAGAIDLTVGGQPLRFTLPST